ncbi:SDR family NAD(P)-dependent oxidoreductase [Sphingomonas bacterium]|uniref:SDR family NAD(P)-dependent oxidoreductase n=1 Tax=Sphingomonas bacterium TaxID=1895847 RepID=UPI0020C6C9D3|nr:SDR family NAD(P)-dependent oxidoreductase [Sphingomonas bacterium]
MTGGASGIDRATARRSADDGAQVVIGDIDAAGRRAIAQESNGRIVFRRCDVTSEADIVALLKLADDAGDLDILFNNAGAGERASRSTPSPPARISDRRRPDDRHARELGCRCRRS